MLVFAAVAAFFLVSGDGFQHVHRRKPGTRTLFQTLQYPFCTFLQRPQHGLQIRLAFDLGLKSSDQIEDFGFVRTGFIPNRGESANVKGHSLGQVAQTVHRGRIFDQPLRLVGQVGYEVGDVGIGAADNRVELGKPLERTDVVAQLG